MDNKRKPTAIETISVAILVGTLVITPLLYSYLLESLPEFVPFQGEWIVTVNDTYQFEIESWGEYNWGIYNETKIEQLLGLNGTLINVTITTLPTLDFLVIKTSFIDKIVVIQKVSCIFSNGSEMPTIWSEVISKSISGCIIPVGSWQTLDAYYPTYRQIWEAPFSREEPYFSELQNESFQFGKFRWGIDDVERWNGTISLESGFPSAVSWRYAHGFGPLAFELILIS